MIVIAAHTGAGCISPRNVEKNERLLKCALEEGIEVYQVTKCIKKAVLKVVCVLENDSLTNAGVGGNLTESGKRQNDAGFSFTSAGGSRGHGAVCGIDKVLNPIEVAGKLADDQAIGNDRNGRVPPVLLSGPDADEYARRHDLSTEELPVSTKSRQIYEKYTKILKREAEDLSEYELPSKIQKSSDTVGVVAMRVFKDTFLSEQVSATSSGGLILKKNGRVGSAASLGAGFWSQNDSCSTCTGCGEEMMIQGTARLSCSPDFLYDQQLLVQDFQSQARTGKELGVLKLVNVSEKNISIELQTLHTTPDFIFGSIYFNQNSVDPPTIIHSKNPSRSSATFSSVKFE